MKILCEFANSGPFYVRSGWGKVFAALGHKFSFWNKQTKSAFDAFNEFEPDIFLGTTYEVDRAIYKCIAARPQMKVGLFASAWGERVDSPEATGFPIHRASEAEKRTIERLKAETGRPDFVFIHVSDAYLQGVLGGWESVGVKPIGVMNGADLFSYYVGRKKAELSCDACMVGAYWPYKAINLDRFILPLCHPSRKLDLKVFGNGAWPVHNYLGSISQQDESDLYASATICLNVSEPHSTSDVLGHDLIERPIKTALNGFVISDYVPEAATQVFTNNEVVFARTPSEFEQVIAHFLANPDERLPYMKRARETVLSGHTYFHRVKKMLEAFGMESEAARCLPKMDEIISKLSAL